MPPNAPAQPTRTPPLQIAADTFVIQAHRGLDGVGVMHLNSMLIRGAEPIVVDTGAPVNQATYLDDLFGLVEPVDVRWLFLSHDDVDHAGSVAALLELCPNATLLTTWVAAQRLALGELSLPPGRCRWLDDGAVLDTGDRALVAQRPPLYDAPGTRGLLDTSTSVFWTADTFAAFVPSPTLDAEELDPDEWLDGFVRFHQWNSPWLDAIDAGWWQRTVARLTARPLDVIVTAHGPVLRGQGLARGLGALRELPSLPLVGTPHPVDHGADLETRLAEDTSVGAV